MTEEQDGRSPSGRAGGPSDLSPCGSQPKALIPSAGFAREWWDFLLRKSFWEDGFCGLLGVGEDFDRLATDDYDESLEILWATNDWRLTEPQQRFLRDAGFHKIYVNHQDGWQTHYTFGEVGLPVRGWRRRYVEDADATTTNVIAGDPNPGYYEISYWPEDWQRREWLETGYMRIVPDALDPFAQGIEAGTDETLQAAQPGGREPGGEAMRPNPSKETTP